MGRPTVRREYFNWERTSSPFNRQQGWPRAFFLSFSWLQILLILLVGPAMAVGTIATERERRTIEYLFVTDLVERGNHAGQDNCPA